MSDILKILVCPANEGGCSFYRAINPYMKLSELFPHKVQIRFDKNPLGIEDEVGKNQGQWKPDWDFESMRWADIVMTQNISNFGGQYTARIVGKAHEFGKFVHYDTDDLLTNLYEGHRLEDVYKNKGLSDITKFIYNNSNLVTVTQNKFAERIKPYLGNGKALAVIKNAIDYNLPSWNHDKQPPPHQRVCRFGWAGGIHHEEDVKEFAGVPHRVNQKVGRENIVWHFFGKPPDTGEDNDRWQQDVWTNYEKTMMRGDKGTKNHFVHHALPPDNYGGIFTMFDVALAPLQMNEFNDSKSEIKVAECGRYNIPLIASDVGCYSETIVNGETGYLIDPDAPKSEWVRILTKVAKNRKLRERMGQNLHELTEEYFDLNKVVKHRLDLYEECFQEMNFSLESIRNFKEDKKSD